jgi:carboxyl-terminal processing protease
MRHAPRAILARALLVLALLLGASAPQALGAPTDSWHLAQALSDPLLLPRAPLTLQALAVLEREYADPVDPIALLNAAIAGLRQQTRLLPDDLPPIPAGTPKERAATLFVQRLARAASASGMGFEQLDAAAASAMLASLHDSHTRYLTDDDLRQFQNSLNGDPSYSGIGVLVQETGAGTGSGRVYVRDVYPDSPAEAAGIRPLDRILAVDGHKPDPARPIESIVPLVRGPEGSTVTLTLSRQGRTLVVRVRRAPITVPTVTVSEPQPGIALVRLYQFGLGAARDTARALARIAGLRGIVLDLRGNPGGLIDEAVGVASLFLPQGTPIVTLRDHDSSQTLTSSGPDDPRLLHVPITVLTDSDSASGSEIVASALQDAHRAAIVGETTAGALGAGAIAPLRQGAVMVTVMRIAGPRGETIEGAGVRPDVPASFDPEDADRGIDTALAAAVASIGGAAIRP